MNEPNTLIRVRDFIFSSQLNKLDLNKIAHGINKPLNELLLEFPHPEALAKRLLQLDFEELNAILDKNVFEKEGAVDSIILASISIFHAFETVSPFKNRFVKKLYPELYKTHLKLKLSLIEDHLSNNLTKGIKNGEYHQELAINEVLKKYIDRIKAIHSEKIMKTEHFTFSAIFHNIFEDYIKEVATSENWHYFRNRKQLIDALNFGK
ncbi:hypothetical protein [Carboxylicivirga sp. N1Y90]|uniref:hypothetical protein n=1 Tax=Carboxylicivirga fragile TaxID=3417571 RepID=UPI003D356983|nr:hypothetical protein [Marinilabiliaceae bacterium N1Y90]